MLPESISIAVIEPNVSWKAACWDVEIGTSIKTPMPGRRMERFFPPIAIDEFRC